MSDSRLNVGITATDTASAQIKVLEAQIRGLQKAITELNAMSTTNVSVQKHVEAYKAEMAAIQQTIAAKRSQISVTEQHTSAIQRSGQVAQAAAQQTEVSLRRTLNAANDLDNALMKAFNRAPASSKAAMDAQVQYYHQKLQEIVQGGGAQFLNRSANSTLSGSQFFGAQARRHDEGDGSRRMPSPGATPYSAAGAFSAFEGKGLLGASGSEIAAAQYENQMRTLIAAHERSMAEYENVNRELAARYARSLAEYENAARMAEAQHTRAQAEYANRDTDLAYRRDRALAEHENRDYDMRQRARQREERASGMSGGMAQREARHAVAIVDSLARGQRGQAFSSLGAAARDAGLGVGGLTASMGALVAVMGAGAILRGAQHLGEWATKTQAAASAAGMGLQQYSSLQGALSLVGVKADSADATLRRMAVNLGTALADPTSKAAEAFHALGISQEMLAKNGQSVEGALKLIASAYERTAEGANKSAAMSEIFGRGFEAIIPALEKGADGFAALEAEAKRLGITLNDTTAAKLREAGDAVTHLGEAIRGEGINSMIAWSGVIKEVAQQLETLIHFATQAASVVGGLAKYLPSNMLVRMGMSFLPKPGQGGPGTGPGTAPTPYSGAKTEVPGMPSTHNQVTVVEQMREEMGRAALAAAQKGGSSQQMRQNELKAEMQVMQETLNTRRLSAKEMGSIAQELTRKQIEFANAGAKSGESAAKQSYADFASAEKLKISEAHGSSAQIAAIYDEWINAANTKYREHASVVMQIEKEKVNAVRASRLAEVKEEIKDYEQADRLKHLNLQLGALGAGTAKVQGEHTGPGLDIKRGQEFAQQAMEVERAYKVQIEALRAYGATSQEIVGVEIRAKAEELALYQKAAAAMQAATNKIIAPLVTMFDSIGSHLDQLGSSIVSSLIAPQVTLEKRGLTSVKTSNQGDEMRSAFRSAIIGIAGDFAKSMKEVMGHVIANVLSQGASNTIGELLSNSLGKLATSVLPSLAGSLGGQAASSAVSGTAISSAVAAAATATTTGISTAVATSATAITTAVATSSGAIVAAIGAAASTEDLLLTAINLKPSALGFTYAGGGIVPSAAGGMVIGGSGGGTQIAKLHEKEMVLPAHISQGIQNMIGNGTNNSNASLNYSPTINTGSRSRGGTGMSRSEFGQMLSSHGSALLGEARKMMHNGWRPA